MWMATKLAFSVNTRSDNIKVVKPRLKHSALLQNEDRVSLNLRQIKTKRHRNENAVADEGGVKTERMNKRKRQNTKELTKKSS